VALPLLLLLAGLLCGYSRGWEQQLQLLQPLLLLQASSSRVQMV
jgi:hypothetical protein